MTRLHFFASVSFVAISLTASQAAELEAGVALTDVTPPIGYRMCGYFYEQLSTGVRDPLHAKALYLHQSQLPSRSYLRESFPCETGTAWSGRFGGV